MTLFDDTLIRALMSNVRATMEFPFLKLPPPAVQPGCPSCKKQTRPITSEDVVRIKSVIVNMPADQQQRLLTLAGLGQAQIVYRDSTGTHRQTLG